MKFYTNIQLIGNQFLIRGYENGKHITHREEWKPTLFVPSKRKTKYKTLEGESVEPIQPGFVRDCREFYKKYDEVENFKIYGNDRYVYQYISEKYPEDHIQFDIKKIRLVTIVKPQEQLIKLYEDKVNGRDQGNQSSIID